MQSYLSVHYLRGIAAIGIVLFHGSGFVAGYGEHGLPPELMSFFEAGVDVFFVISGFILTMATQKPVDGKQFALGRLARVGIPYWCILTALVVASLAMPSAFRSFSWDLSDYLLSLAFIPSIKGDGTIFPILQPGWTLSLEMLFYTLLAASLGLAAAYRSWAICAALFALAATGLVLDLPDGSSALWFFTQAMVVEFAFGIALAHACLRWPEIGKFPALAMIVVGLAGLAVAVVYPPKFFSAMRVISYGIPAALIVSGAVFLESAGGWFESRVLLFLGTISYSLYLTHVITLGVTTKVLAGHLSGAAGDYFMLFAGVGAAIAVGAVYYRVVEQPSLWLSHKMKRKRSTQPPHSVPTTGDLTA